MDQRLFTISSDTAHDTEPWMSAMPLNEFGLPTLGSVADYGKVFDPTTGMAEHDGAIMELLFVQDGNTTYFLGKAGTREAEFRLLGLILEKLDENQE